MVRDLNNEVRKLSQQEGNGPGPERWSKQNHRSKREKVSDRVLKYAEKVRDLNGGENRKTLRVLNAGVSREGP